MAAPAGLDAASPLGFNDSAAAVPVGSVGFCAGCAGAGAWAAGVLGLLTSGAGVSGSWFRLIGGIVGCPGIGG